MPADFIVWTVYCGVCGVLFIVIKMINYRLHYMYDTSEMIEEESSENGASTASEDKNEEPSKTSETGTSKSHTQG